MDFLPQEYNCSGSLIHCWSYSCSFEKHKHLPLFTHRLICQSASITSATIWHHFPTPFNPSALPPVPCPPLPSSAPFPLPPPTHSLPNLRSESMTTTTTTHASPRPLPSPLPSCPFLPKPPSPYPNNLLAHSPPDLLVDVNHECHHIAMQGRRGCEDRGCDGSATISHNVS
ncbi:unnamed protein product [Closterium sp. NIES-54]